MHFTNLINCGFDRKTKKEFKKNDIIKAIIYPTTKAKFSCKNIDKTYEKATPFTVFTPPTIKNIKKFFFRKCCFIKRKVISLYFCS